MARAAARLHVALQRSLFIWTSCSPSSPPCRPNNIMCETVKIFGVESSWHANLAHRAHIEEERETIQQKQSTTTQASSETIQQMKERHCHWTTRSLLRRDGQRQRQWPAPRCAGSFWATLRSLFETHHGQEDFVLDTADHLVLVLLHLSCAAFFVNSHSVLLQCSVCGTSSRHRCFKVHEHSWRVQRLRGETHSPRQKKPHPPRRASPSLLA